MSLFIFLYVQTMTGPTDSTITQGSVNASGEARGETLGTPEIANTAKKNSDLVPDPTSDASDKSEKDDDDARLPFSKARSIALVATLTGASFLNVSRIPKKENERKIKILLRIVFPDVVREEGGRRCRRK